MTETLNLRNENGVLWLQLNRPDAKNAIDDIMLAELQQTLEEAEADPKIRALLIYGNEKAFCTGADLAPSDGSTHTGAAEGTLLLDYRKGTDAYKHLFKTYWEIELPVVTAIEGTVAGVGWMLALLADLVVAAEGARWIHIFAERGMAPHAGDPYFLPRVIPFHALNEAALLRERFTSEDLHRWGCVNRLVPQAEVQSTAGDLVERLAAGPTRSLGQAKRLYRRSLDSDMLTAFGEEAAALALLAETHDRKEGVQSLIEKRQADFKGR